MGSRHIIKQIWHFGFLQYQFYCTLKNDIALGASAECNVIFQSAIKIDIAGNQVPYLDNISFSVTKSSFVFSLYSTFIFSFCIQRVIFATYTLQ